MQNLDEYIDMLVTKKGFAEKDPEVIEQIKKDLLDRVEDRINAMIVTTIKEADMAAFDAVLDGGDDAEMETFVKAHIPDIDQKVASELVSFATIYLG